MSKRFQSSKSPMGPFEAALERGRPELLEDARLDYILKEGRAGVKNELVKAYLLGKNDPSPNSNLVLKSLDLDSKRNDHMLEARLLAGKIVDVDRDQRESKYSLSLLAEVVAHPYLNSDLVREMNEAEREKKLRELEEFYQVPVEEILAFIEFKRTEAKIEKFQMDGRKALNVAELSEEQQKQLEVYQSNTLKQFFRPETTDAQVPESMIEYDLSQRSQGDTILSVEQEMPEYKETFDHRPENESIEDKRKYYAYDHPLRYKDREHWIHGQNYAKLDLVAKKYKVFPATFGSRPKWRPYRPAFYDKSLKESSISEMVERLRSDHLEHVERLQLIKTIFHKQNELGIANPHEDIRVYSRGSRSYKRRGLNWEIQEQVKERVSNESRGQMEADIMVKKGAFTQMDRYEFGLGLPEQAILGVLNFKEAQAHEDLSRRLEKTKFARLLKRRIKEYLQESGFDTIETRKDLFLAIEKGARQNQLPELEDEVLLGLIMHPWSFEYLQALHHPGFFSKYSITSCEALEEFIGFLESLPEHHETYYSEFLQLFQPHGASDSLLATMKTFWARNMYRDVPLNPVWLARIVAGLQIETGQEVDINLLSSLQSLKLKTADAIEPVFSSADMKRMVSNEAVGLFYLELLLSSDPSDLLRFLKISNDIFANLGSKNQLISLLIRLMSTYDEGTLREALIEPVAECLDMASHLGRSRVLREAFDEAQSLRNRFLADNDQTFESESNRFLEYAPKTQLFIRYRSPLLKYNMRDLIEHNTEYKLLRPLIESTVLEKSLEQYTRLKELFEIRTSRPLPEVVGADQAVDWAQVARNKQTISEYYQLSVKRRISEADATLTEEKKGAFYQNKLKRRKGLNFGSRVARHYFSERKSRVIDNWDDFNRLFQSYEDVEKRDQDSFLDEIKRSSKNLSKSSDWEFE